MQKNQQKWSARDDALVGSWDVRRYVSVYGLESIAPGTMIHVTHEDGCPAIPGEELDCTCYPTVDVEIRGYDGHREKRVELQG